jgi:tRNA-splicing ligase RtcB
MMQILNDKLLNWASIIAPQTLEQAFQTASMPFVQPWLALMPDAHLGKGATVGSVIPTMGAIMPAAVGVDIGCGMNAVLTQFRRDDLLAAGDLRVLHAAISKDIPLSAGKYNSPSGRAKSSRIFALESLPGIEQAEEVSPNWRLQLGSLGSGNHFIEVSLDEDDRVWMFLHSGSRGVGNRLAQKHIEVAQKLCDGKKLPNRDLAYLEEGTSEFDSYIEALNWAQQFALLNRIEMMGRVSFALSLFMGREFVQWRQDISCHHNYTEKLGDGVWLSRKGAINAEPGQWGLIPGSMGTRSYVVQGLGNESSFNSAPHGAGREYSRSKAKSRFTREDLDARMEGIAWGESDAFLDEHPDAYKDVEVVMNDSSDLVEVRYVLRQIVNIKGD